MSTPSAFDRYMVLLSRVDSFTALVRDAYAKEIKCGPGCSECCNNMFTVFAVEAHNLRSGFAALPRKAQDAALGKLRGSSPKAACPLLDKYGLCLLYDRRPIICRTHGYPFSSGLLRVDGQKVTSFCEKNFTSMPDLSALANEHVLNLDVLNSTLTAINLVFMKEQGTEGMYTERLWPAEIFIR